MPEVSQVLLRMTVDITENEVRTFQATRALDPLTIAKLRNLEHMLMDAMRDGHHDLSMTH